MTPIVNRALGYKKQLPARTAYDIEQALKICLALEFIIDGTERPVRRPKDKVKQKENYSGKKKRHMLKNNVVTEKSTKKIRALSAACEGKKHDKTLAEEQSIPFPKGSKVWKDLGFQGYEPEGTITYQPMKKSKGKKLTTEQKQRNKDVSREHIGVEHSIGGVKVFAIVHTVYRNFRERYEDFCLRAA